MAMQLQSCQGRRIRQYAAPREVRRGRLGEPCQVTLLVGARLTDYDLVLGSRTQEFFTHRRVRPVAQARHHLARLR